MRFTPSSIEWYYCVHGRRIEKSVVCVRRSGTISRLSLHFTAHMTTAPDCKCARFRDRYTMVYMVWKHFMMHSKMPEMSDMKKVIKVCI